MSEDSLIRLLNAYVHFVGNLVCFPTICASCCEHHSIGDSSICTYVQGLNVVAAPFLYTMPEVDAFFAFTKLILHHVPLYAEKSRFCESIVNNV